MNDPYPDPFGPGDVIGGYRLVAQIGRGSMGRVFEAVQLSMERVVALKVLPMVLADDEQFVQRFLREARLAAALSSPYVVAVHDAGVDDGVLYLSMEFAEGGDLQQRVRAAGGELPASQVTRVMRDCARGLEAIERCGLIHRDIKPANIFVDGSGRAKLGDLGLARDLADASHISNTGLVVGTPAYMSPEQSQGVGQLDIRSDIFALGATCFRLLTGVDPFPGTRISTILRKVRGEQAVELSEPLQQADEDSGLARIIRRCMRRDPALRYQHAGELVADLDLLLDDDRRPPGTDAGTTIATRRQSGRLNRVLRQARIQTRRHRRDRGTVALLVVLALLSLLAIVLALNR